MIVFFAAIVMISGKRSAKISGSKNVSESFAQSALKRDQRQHARWSAP